MKQTTVELIDDLDGTPIAKGAGRTVSFSLDGAGYEVDLSEANVIALQELLAPYVKAGRKVTAGVASRRRATRRTTGTSNRPGNVIIRAWAKENGFKVSDRGALSASVLEAYDTAHA